MLFEIHPETLRSTSNWSVSGFAVALVCHLEEDRVPEPGIAHGHAILNKILAHAKSSRSIVTVRSLASTFEASSRTAIRWIQAVAESCARGQYANLTSVLHMYVFIDVQGSSARGRGEETSQNQGERAGS